MNTFFCDGFLVNIERSWRLKGYSIIMKLGKDSEQVFLRWIFGTNLEEKAFERMF